MHLSENYIALKSSNEQQQSISYLQIYNLAQKTKVKLKSIELS
jgi:hypothetical protein